MKFGNINLSVILFITLISCVDRELGKVDPSISTKAIEDIVQITNTQVDILFVIDNSHSMAGEQIALAQNFPVLINELLNPTIDENHDGIPDSPPVEDMHIGIVSTDLGVGNNNLGSKCTQYGDQGYLINEYRCEADENTSTLCPVSECQNFTLGSNLWIDYKKDDPNHNNQNDITQAFTCIARLGTEGCGIEQQLEAAYQALVINTRPGGVNEGFLREDSLIAIIFVTDEDDCSFKDASTFFRGVTDKNANIWCFLESNESKLWDLNRYYEGFRGLRPMNPDDKVVVAAIAGIPLTINIDGREEELDWSKLTDSQKQELLQYLEDTQNTIENDNIKKICESQFRTNIPKADEQRYADPASRIAELIYRFGSNGYIHSICEGDWRKALLAITRKIQDKLRGTCMAREINVDEGCKVIKTINKNSSCRHFEIEIGIVRNEQGVEYRECEIPQSSWDPNSPEDTNHNHIQDEGEYVQKEGWYYLPPNLSPHACPEIMFTQGAILEEGAKARIECSTPLCPLRRQCQPGIENADEKGCCYENYYCKDGIRCVEDRK